MFHLKRGGPTESEREIELIDGTAIKQLVGEETYTYLGNPQRAMNEISKIKQKLTDQYLNKLKKIWDAKLNAKNKCMATNVLALPIVSHSFGCIRWTVDEILNLDRKTRKVITTARSLHPNSSIQRLYLPRKLGGRGLKAIDDTYRKAVITTACRVFNTKDPLLRIAKQHEQNGKGTFLFKAAQRAAEDYGLILGMEKKRTGIRKRLVEMEQKELNNSITQSILSRLQQQHMEKHLHSQYYKNMENQQLSQELTFGFLRSSGLYSETEGFIMACQDGVFPSLEYKKLILGFEINDTK